MKKNIYLILVNSIFLCFSVTSLFAESVVINPINDNCAPSNNLNVTTLLENCGTNTVGVNPKTNGTGQAAVRERVKSIVEKGITLGSVIAIIFLVWAGIQYTLSYGDDEKVKHAKSTGTYALIGLILMMASFALIDIFLGFIFQIAGAA